MYKGAAFRLILSLINARLALLILAVISNSLDTLSKNSSLVFDCIARRGRLTVTTPRDPIFVDPAPKLKDH